MYNKLLKCRNSQGDEEQVSIANIIGELGKMLVNTDTSYTDSIYQMLEKQLEKSYKPLFKSLNINLKDFAKYAKELSNEEYVEKLFELLTPSKNVHDKKNLDACMTAIKVLDIYNCMKTDKRISLYLPERTLDFKKIAEGIDLDLTDRMRDEMIGLRLSFVYPDKTYADVTVQVEPLESNFTYKGEVVEGNLFTIVKGERIFGSFYYLKKYPKHIFIPYDFDTICTDICDGQCEECVKTTLKHTTPRIPKEFVKEIDINCCRLSLRQIENEQCLIKSVFVTEVVKIAVYAYTMYLNRKNITRKNSPTKRTYENSHKIGVELTEHYEEHLQGERIISLDKYSAYEKNVNTHAGSKHSSHKAPIEHERRGHQRVYRNEDGSIRKIVEIKPSVINKGKGGDVIYKTSLPKK